jgi:replication factor C small subunit
MDPPLWTDAHAPSLSELPQADARDRLWRAVEEPMNLVVQGPTGVGKTAAARALAREAHADPDNDLIEINVADFFARSKSEIRDDPRFEHLLQGQTAFSKQYRSGTDKRNKYKRDWSKRDMVSHVLKEMAGYKPSTGAYKTIVLDNAESIREDFQQALRRVMERYHRGTQFVITTRQPSKLIPPIRSRCFPVPMRAPTAEETARVLRAIVEAEDVEYDEDGLTFVAGYASGNLRRAVLGAQTTVVEAGELTMTAAHEALGDVEDDGPVEAALSAAESGDLDEARSTVEDLLDEAGYDGSELLRAILRVARKRHDGADLARLHILAADADADLAESTDPGLHVTRLLARWAAPDPDRDATVDYGSGSLARS